MRNCISKALQLGILCFQLSDQFLALVLDPFLKRNIAHHGEDGILSQRSYARLETPVFTILDEVILKRMHVTCLQCSGNGKIRLICQGGQHLSNFPAEELFRWKQRLIDLGGDELQDGTVAFKLKDHIGDGSKQSAYPRLTPAQSLFGMFEGGNIQLCPP